MRNRQWFFFKNAVECGDPENLYRGFWEIFFFRGGGICADPDKSVIFIVTIQLIIFEIIGMPMYLSIQLNINYEPVSLGENLANSRTRSKEMVIFKRMN